ncbi:hypothetical protein PSI23_14860 [Xenorhabdus sp. XENO-10]|uniref:Inverse autotransporter beta-barrel domain-containing protein n=1 Tax=Xenorhabdus yunnanensis TaxID=3025878 RepID=A0ABT5LHF0_9GAMM|nr:hypothetical protein [Xenorhabdus yunnanensis]MDC9590532.1 hypothetical protein [Xenorhabdus yunnanensis]
MSKHITTSVISGSDIVIGQTLYLDIILTSDDPISNDASINLTRFNNAEPEDDIPQIKLYDNGKKGIFTVELSVFDDLPDRDSVSFYIEPNANAAGFPETKIEYTARTVNMSSLQLKIGADHLKVPQHPNIPPSGRFFVSVHATVTAQDGKDKLSGTPINILDIDGVFDRVDFYTADKNSKLEVRDIGDYRGLTINTDSNGNLAFYIFAKQDKTVVLNLFSAIMGVEGTVEAERILYIIDVGPVNPGHTLNPPVINGEVGGVLHKSIGSKHFSVNIPMYNDISVGDSIFFLVNKLMVDPPVNLTDPSTQLNNILVSYAVLSDNNEVEFSYVVIKESAERYMSMPTVFTYVKDELPADNVYEKCKVYASFGTGENDLITEGKVVNCKVISGYNKNPDQDGLFVKITGTNDPHDQTKVPLGNNVNVTLWLHIRAKQKKLDKSIGSIPMPDIAGSDGVTNSVIIGIPQTYLAGSDTFDEYHPAQIYFYYIVNIDGQHIKSQTWKGKIDTVPSWGTPHC